MKEVKTKTSFLNFFRLLFRNRLGEMLLLPFTRGKNWNAFAARIPANHYQYPKRSLREVTRNGFQFRLDISDYMQWLIYFGVSIEPRDKLFAQVKPGMTVLDIGANIGETALEFSRITGPGGHVFAFEPDPKTFAHLQHHLAVNNITNVTALNIGLGDADGTFTLQQNEKHSGGNRIGNGNGVLINVQKGDTLMNELGIAPGFIKIDVEGFEERVLNGLFTTIEKHRPVIFIETIDAYLKLQDTSADSVIRWLAGRNYRLENAFTGQSVSPNEEHDGLHCDIIARPV